MKARMRYKKIAAILTLAVIIVVFFGGAVAVFAQSPGTQGGPTAGSPGSQNGGNTNNLTLPNPLGCGSFGCVTTNIINFIYTLAIPICALMVLWGGFQMVTSAGNPEKFSSGRKTILYAALGFVVILLANSISGFIQAFFKTS